MTISGDSYLHVPCTFLVLCWEFHGKLFSHTRPRRPDALLQGPDRGQERWLRGWDLRVPRGQYRSHGYGLVAAHGGPLWGPGAWKEITRGCHLLQGLPAAVQGRFHTDQWNIEKKKVRFSIKIKTSTLDYTPPLSSIKSPFLL